MEKEINESRAKRNIALYKKYKLFSYDLIFYYAVEVLFYTVVKGFSLSELMYLSSIYAFSAFVWQLFGSFIVDKIGIKKSIITGNILVTINMFLFIVSTEFWMFAFANCFMSLGFALKSLTESNLLYGSLKKIGKRESFSKVEGKSVSRFYIIDAIASIISGFLFVINGYLPFILCFVTMIIATIISFGFEDLKVEDEDEKLTIRENLRSFREIILHKRNKAMLLFAFVFWGLVSVIRTLYRAIILDIGIKEEYSTMVVFIATVFIALGSRAVYGIEKVTKNRTLTVFTYVLLISSMVIGIVGLYNNLTLASLSIFLIALALISIIQGAYRVAIKRYVLNFTTHKYRNKITSSYYIVENLGQTLILFISGLILEFTTNSIACIMFSVVALIIMSLILIYMKDKIGLRPEQYENLNL